MAKKRPKYTADQLQQLLAQRHAKDVFVPQCKDGPTWGCEHSRLDAWAMARSWASPWTAGYEIKVSRSDFVNDTKWRGYLGYCDLFYFVAPPGIIEVDELPAEAGLLVCSTNATRLYAKKKAPHREVVVPEAFYRYILMCRADIREDRYDHLTGAAYWRAWLAKRAEEQEIGYAASRRIGQIMEEKVYKVEAQQMALKKRLDRYGSLERWLKEMGVDYENTWDVERSAKRAVERSRELLPELLVSQLRSASSALDRTITVIEHARGEQRESDEPD